MEHAQREFNLKLRRYETSVLILILMEHAQRGQILYLADNSSCVLILILMEHAQRASKDYEFGESTVKKS